MQVEIREFYKIVKLEKMELWDARTSLYNIYFNNIRFIILITFHGQECVLTTL